MGIMGCIDPTVRVTLSRVSNYPYLYILYSTLRYELWKLERCVACESKRRCIFRFSQREEQVSFLTPPSSLVCRCCGRELLDDDTITITQKHKNTMQNDV